MPPTAILPSAIIRSISRREAMPARASSLAIRWPSLSGALSRAGIASSDSSASPKPIRVRAICPDRHKSPDRSLRERPTGGVRRYMLFGKRERRIRRILIVEDEPLVAFDNEYMLRDAGYEIVATVDSPADAIEVIDDRDARSRPDRHLPEGRRRRRRRGAGGRREGHCRAVRHRQLQRPGQEPRSRLPRQALFRTGPVEHARNDRTRICRGAR